MAHRLSNRKGFTLLAGVACAAIIFGGAGLAVDLGRLYITKSEAQAFADSAALYAAQQLDSTSSGLNQAQSAVLASVQRWNFGQSSFTGTTVEFSTNGVTNWYRRADVPTSDVPYVRYVRVTPTVANMRLFFLPVLSAVYPSAIPQYATVNAQAIGGQVLKTTFGGGGIFPFSPIAHAYGNTAEEVYAADPTGNFGYTVGAARLHPVSGCEHDPQGDRRRLHGLRDHDERAAQHVRRPHKRRQVHRGGCADEPDLTRR
jgi:Flp pilus assembly protein TadG